MLSKTTYLRCGGGGGAGGGTGRTLERCRSFSSSPVHEKNTEFCSKCLLLQKLLLHFGNYLGGISIKAALLHSMVSVQVV